MSYYYIIILLDSNGIENGEFAGVNTKISVLQSHISLKFTLQTYYLL